MLISRWQRLVAVIAAFGVLAAGTVWGGGLGSPGRPPSIPLEITTFTGSGSLDREWIFSGTVSGGDGSPITVTFGGLDSLQGKSVPVVDGEFLLIIELAPGEGGIVDATARNKTQTSNTAEYLVLQ